MTEKGNHCLDHQPLSFQMQNIIQIQQQKNSILKEQYKHSQKKWDCIRKLKKKNLIMYDKEMEKRRQTKLQK